MVGKGRRWWWWDVLLRCLQPALPFSAKAMGAAGGDEIEQAKGMRDDVCNQEREVSGEYTHSVE